MKCSLFLLCLMIVFACSKSDTAVPSNKFIGTWRLTTYCKPTGSSTCTTVNVPTDKGVFIVFDKAGKFNELYVNTKPVEYGFLGCGSGDYSIESGQLRIRASCMSSLQGRLIKVISVDDNRLILIPFDTGAYLFVK